MVGGLAEEEVGNKDLVLVVLVISVSKDVGALAKVNKQLRRKSSRQPWVHIKEEGISFRRKEASGVPAGFVGRSRRCHKQ